MPFIDEERGVLVLRIVYDGPPFSGKTTSLKTLASRLGIEVVTPAEENGRTLFFDWADYVGGLFEGRRIRCQIVSVPGQADFERRRQALLEAADAVIFVADTRASALEPSLRALGAMVEHCRMQRPPVGVVMQANKRDDASSVPIGALRARLSEIAPIAVNETIATDGDGVRETFVFAVRLALDRVRAMTEAGDLRMGRPDIDAPSDLLANLEALEDDARAEQPTLTLSEAPECAEAAGRAAESIEEAVLAADRFRAELAFTPDPSMPGGFIWPPVDGRALLHEVSKLGLEPRRNDAGEWEARGGGWRFHSTPHAIHEGAAAGRSALVAWARLHAGRIKHLSAGRVLVLADAGEDRHRVWQLLRVQPSLRDSVRTALRDGSPADAARDLSVIAGKLALARELFADVQVALPCTLRTIGCDRTGQPVYVGLMPDPGHDAAPLPGADDLIERELAPLMQQLRREHDGFLEIVRALRSNARTAPGHGHVRIVADIGARTAEHWYGIS